MSKRSYNHRSGLALALDAVGERWTLLIIRELLMGPKRFMDLQDGLPGINTNLLSNRLKDLEKLSIIYKHKLPPPAGSMVYELTPTGKELEGAVAELAKFGMRLLQFTNRETKGFAFRIGWLAHMLRYHYDRELAAGLDESYELRVGDEVVSITIANGRVQTASGTAKAPVVRIGMSSEVFMALDTGELSWEEAVAEGEVEISGDRAAADRVFRLFAHGESNRSEVDNQS